MLRIDYKSYKSEHDAIKAWLFSCGDRCMRGYSHVSFFAKELARDLYFSTDFWGGGLLEEPTAELHHHSRRRRTTAGSHCTRCFAQLPARGRHTHTQAHTRATADVTDARHTDRQRACVCVRVCVFAAGRFSSMISSAVADVKGRIRSNVGSYS